MLYCSMQCCALPLLQTLASRRILSAPVISAAGESHQPLGAHWPQEQALQGNNSILGFIDIRDILSSFLRGKKPRITRKGAPRDLQ